MDGGRDFDGVETNEIWSFSGRVCTGAGAGVAIEAWTFIWVACIRTWLVSAGRDQRTGQHFSTGRQIKYAYTGRWGWVDVGAEVACLPDRGNVRRIASQAY